MDCNGCSASWEAIGCDHSSWLTVFSLDTFCKQLSNFWHITVHLLISLYFSLFLCFLVSLVLLIHIIAFYLLLVHQFICMLVFSYSLSKCSILVNCGSDVIVCVIELKCINLNILDPGESETWPESV